jgi:hypothetical protein
MTPSLVVFGVACFSLGFSSAVLLGILLRRA